MTVYTFSAARQKLATLLDKARKEGEVLIQRRDGSVFVLKPHKKNKASPLNTKSLNLHLGIQEIVRAIRKGRRKF